MSKIEITVIICTLGIEGRNNQLFRAIESVLAQNCVIVRPVVVLNGTQYSDSVYKRLKNNNDIILIKTNKKGLKNARTLGRESVATEYFCFLDDDDEILPGGLKKRAEPFLLNDTIDIVSTNGLIENSGTHKQMIATMLNCDDLAVAALKNIWLNSGSALFKTKSIPMSIHQEAPEMFEWTYIALKLSIDKKIVLLNENTYIIHLGSEQQMTQSIEYVRKQHKSIELMSRLPLSNEAKSILRKKHASSLHSLAFRELSEGNILQSWKFHIMSIANASGWKYITSSHHFLNPFSHKTNVQ